MEKPWKVVAAFVAVFIAGAVFGGLFTLRASGKRLADWRANDKPGKVPAPATAPIAAGPTAATSAGSPPAANIAAARVPVPIQPAIMQQLIRQLKLTAAQKEKVRPIVSRASEDLQRLRQDNDTERQRNIADTVRVTDRMYSDVAALLPPEQRVELESMRTQMQHRVEKDRRRRVELQAIADAQMTAEKAADGDAKASPIPPPAVPAAKPAEKGK